VDPVALIEEAYQPYPDPSSWLQATTENVVRAIDPTYLAAMSYVLGSHGPEQPMAVVNGQVEQREVQQMVVLGWTMSDPEDSRAVAAACRKPGISTLRQTLGDTSVERWLERCRDWPVALADAVAVVLPRPDGKPLLLSVACARPRRLEVSEKAVWHRIAIHLSASWRLAGRRFDVEAEDVEAILTADGQVTHGCGLATTKGVRELLSQATKNIDRARSRSGRSDPIAALELWQGLLAGRWSLVEHFDSDGKRFMLARRNAPDFPDPAALTQRQRQVLFYVSLGLSNKETAYALGLAETRSARTFPLGSTGWA
jgi:hypothetical protein